MTATQTKPLRRAAVAKPDTAITPVRPRIATVPDASVAAKYIGRTIQGVQDFDIFRYAREHAINILISGPTGPGKTMATRAFCATEGLAFFAVSSNVGASPDQLFGKYNPNEEAKTDADPKWVWIDGPVTDLVRNGGVLLINEVNFLPARVATVLFQLLDGNRQITLLDHHGEVIRAHIGPVDPSDPTSVGCWCTEADCSSKRLLVVADMNPDYAGTSTLNAAFKNRFPFQLDWPYSPDVETKLIRSDTLRKLAAGLRQQHDEGAIETPCSTNMLLEFEVTVDRMGNIPFAVEMFVNHFAQEERSAVKNAIDIVIEELTSDFAAPAAPVAEEADDPTIDPEWDFSNLPGSDAWDFTTSS